VPNTLLLADDSVTIQRVIELTFADEDVQVIAVSDGDQAIERLQASPPDIVLADIGMPGKNGYEVAQFVRQTPGLSHIPVVLLTGAFEPVDQARANEAGCDGVLAKPFEPQLVISRVKELLGRRQPSPVPAAAPAAASPWPPAAPAATASNTVASPHQLDDYFDRLDAAFSSFNAPAATPAAPPQPATANPEEIDWFSTTSGPAPEGWDLPPVPGGGAQPDPPVSFASPEPAVAFEQASFETAAPPEPPAFDPAPEFDAPVEFEASRGFDPPPPSFASAPDAYRAPVHPPAAVVRPQQVASAAAPAAARAVEEPRAAAAMRAPASLPAVASLPPLTDAFAALLAAEANEGGTAVLAWPASAPEPAMPVATDDLIDDIARRVLERLSDHVIRDTVADMVSRIAEQLVREEIDRIKSSIKQ
jgi:CheY-like chemotaxis protein